MIIPLPSRVSYRTGVYRAEPGRCRRAEMREAAGREAPVPAVPVL